MRTTIRAILHNKFFISGFLLLLIVATGTVGYWFIGNGEYSALDCLYMTVITLTTIGYGEIVDLSNRPGGRVFTIFIALSGIGTLSYIITNFTATIVEGDLRETFRRRRMEKSVSRMKDHYIVCGCGRIGRQIVNELKVTAREFVIVEPDGGAVAALPEDIRNAALEGDATDNAVLVKAGVERAKGVFCATGDDNLNLVISLTARQLNPKARVVARCSDMNRLDKIRSTGADAVVSPTFIGGLRMASEMVRPAVVSFLDIMLRDKDKNLRVEEVAVPACCAGRSLAELQLKKYPKVLLLALRKDGGWTYNPPETQAVDAGDCLIIMTDPQERAKLEKDLQKI